MLTCPSCRRENADDARFCSGCGSALGPAAPAREERKVVTCLFCDLVGFTARAEGMDPEDVRRLLQPYHQRVRSELERFGGTVEKFIGDAVMAVFGAPVAHEDDPERAVRAALSIRDALAVDGELEVRIGITTGEAFIALDARPEAGEGMASGDVVNTAARLQAAAEPGSVLVDEATYRSTATVIEYAEPTAIDAKGKAGPVRVREALVARVPVGAERMRLARLVGRERELTVLRDALGRTLGERQPRLVTLVGVPGVGKSRLAHELRTMVEDGRFGAVTWLRGRSLSYGDGVSFWAFREIVAVAAGILETDSDEVAETKLATSVDSLPVDEPEADWLRGHLAPVLGLRGSRDGDDRRPERFAAWRRFLEARAGVEPLVLVFEDLHWADDGLLDFVASLAEWLSDVPILVVGTARPELLERRPAWPAAERVSVLGLEPLSDAETSSLIDDLLSGSILPAADRAALLEHASGNPLYAEQYARMVAERGEAHAVPETVQALIVARLDALPDAEKRVAQDASVTGDVFWSGSVAAAGRDDRWTIDEHLRSLERKVFVRRSREASVAGEGEWIFAHVLVRDAAYAAIPRAQRAEKHLRVARWIESLGRPDDYAELLAHHYLAALDLGSAAGVEVAELPDRALLAVQQAGDRALALHAFAAATRYYRRALDFLAADNPARARLLLLLGRSLFLSEAGGEDELLAARGALDAARDQDGVTEAETLLAEYYRSAGRPGPYEEHLAAAETLARELGPSPVKARALLAVAHGLSNRGEHEQALAVGTEALALAEGLGLDELRVRGLSVVGWVRLQLEADAGFEDFEQSIELARALNSPEAIRSHANLSHHLRHRGEFRPAVEHVEEALRLADRFGDVPMGRVLRAILPHHRYRQGHWDEALEAAETYLDEVQDSHLHVWHALGSRSLIRLSRGDDRGLEDSTRSIEAARRSLDPTTLPAALEVRARCLVFAGQRVEAEQAIEEALRMLETGIMKAGFDLPHLAFVTVELGRDAERVLAVARPGRWADAARLYLAGEFGRAADLYGDIGSPTDEAEARLRSGQALLEAGRRSEGEADIARALDFYRARDASYFVRLGEASLVPTDSRVAPARARSPRRVP